MGRRKDDPLLQAAKGFPGRRQSKVEQQIEHAAAVAELAVNQDDSFPVPEVFMKAPVYWSEAIKLWREKSDVLKKAGRRRPGYRSALARYCIWNQLYLAASEQLRRDLPRGGTAVKVKKGDGETVIRTHPNIDFMAKAETALRLLDAEFGFTPQRDTDLIRGESFNASQGRLPLGDVPTASSPAGSGIQDPMDLMNDSDSAGPVSRPN